ncbi:MAG: TIGR00282 family metallophosphoesterase [Armatimonadota bacterium]
MLRLLFVGDVMGRPGRRALNNLLGALRAQYSIDFIVANGENAAGGLGATQQTANELLESGVDVITLGNHAFANKEMLNYLAVERRALRPANYPPGTPGNEFGVFETSSKKKIAVVNLLGRVFMEPVDCPFRTADAVLGKLQDDVGAVVVDFHAEATSEKQAMGWYLAGRVAAVIGTHTHVQTSDERVLPGGTAYITDAGMTGVMDSVLGLDKTVVVERFLTRLPGRFAVADGTATLQGVLIEINSETRQAISISRINVQEYQGLT